LSLASAGPISRGLVHYQAQSQLGLASSRPRVIRKFSIVILESLYTQFLLGPSNNSTSKAPTTNLDRYLDGLKDRPCISPLTGYYMHPGKKNKFIKFKEIITSEKKKWLRTNIPQSAELCYQRTAASFFGGYHSVYAFQQKGSSGLTRV
jgi:hypothetical protein